MSKKKNICKVVSPPLGYIKINVEYLKEKKNKWQSTTSSRGAIAVICRGGNEEYRGASAIVFDDISDPRNLEALACRESLAFAANLSVKSVMVLLSHKRKTNIAMMALDCLEVIHSLHGSEEAGLVISSSKSKPGSGTMTVLHT